VLVSSALTNQYVSVCVCGLLVIFIHAQ